MPNELMEIAKAIRELSAEHRAYRIQTAEKIEALTREVIAIRADVLKLRQKNDLPPSLDVAQAAELLHCRKTRIYELMSEGQIERAPKLGRKTTVVTRSVLRLIDRDGLTKTPKRKRVLPGNSTDEHIAKLRQLLW